MEASGSSRPVLECSFDGCATGGNIFDEEIGVCIVAVGQAEVEECPLAHAIAIAAAACSDAAVVARIEDANEEPAVAAASPSPVEVEEVVAVETVENKSMATTRGVAGEEDRIALLNLFIKHVEPIVDTVVVALSYIATVVVAKVLDVGFGAEVGTRRRSVMHVDSLTAIVHQVGNSRILCIGYMIVFPVVGVLHVVPVNRRVARNGFLCSGLPRPILLRSVGDGISGNDGLCLFGEAVEPHHLSHSGGCAACGRS